MASFMVDLWESIFTPGPTPTILKAANGSFAALLVVLLSLLYATHSVHFVVLSVLCVGLWWSINWFAAELAIAQANERREQAKKEEEEQQGEEGEQLEGEQEQEQGDRKKKSKKGGSDKGRTAVEAKGADGDSDTEVEARAATRRSSRRRPAAAAAAASDAEPLKVTGQVKHRAGTPVGALSQSSVSTEDEWEKVSGSEKDKDK